MVSTLESVILEEKLPPQHLKDVEIVPGGEVHRKIAKNHFFNDFESACKDKPEMTFADWYDENLAKKPITEKANFETKSYILLLKTDSVVTDQNVLDSIEGLILEAQKQAKQSGLQVLYEIRVANWREKYCVLIANGSGSKSDTPEKGIPVWLNVGTDAKNYSFVQVKKGDKTELAYIQPMETHQVLTVEYEK
jgi:hypothetical protein